MGEKVVIGLSKTVIDVNIRSCLVKLSSVSIIPLVWIAGMFPIVLIISSLAWLTDSKDPDLSTPTTWRCGVFIPVPDEKFQEPLAKYFVFHKKLEAKCPAKLFFTFSKGVFSKKCAKMVSS